MPRSAPAFLALSAILLLGACSGGGMGSSMGSVGSAMLGIPSAPAMPTEQPKSHQQAVSQAKEFCDATPAEIAQGQASALVFKSFDPKTDRATFTDKGKTITLDDKAFGNRFNAEYANRATSGAECVRGTISRYSLDAANNAAMGKK